MSFEIKERRNGIFCIFPARKMGKTQKRKFHLSPCNCLLPNRKETLATQANFLMANHTICTVKQGRANIAGVYAVLHPINLLSRYSESNGLVLLRLDHQKRKKSNRHMIKSFENGIIT